jgi:hypothetical protein
LTGIVAAEGEIWKEHRRFLIENLKCLDAEEFNTEQAISTQIQNTLPVLKSYASNKDIVPLGKLVSLLVSKTIATAIFGKDVECNDNVMHELITNIESYIEHAMKADIVEFFPILEYLPGDYFGFAGVKAGMSVLLHWIRKGIDEQKALQAEGQPIARLIANYLTASKLAQDKLNNNFTGKIKLL